MEADTDAKIKFKIELQRHCISILEKRFAIADQAMQQAQDAANSEEKSSAGDKYETGRAMGQLSRDMNAKQLEEANRDLAFVRNLPADRIFYAATAGAVVVCDEETYFISLGFGPVEINNKKVILLSPTAPVAREMEGKKAGDQFEFRNIKKKILEIY